MSVLSIEGTDCRLDELGRLADRTGGKVRHHLPTVYPGSVVHVLTLMCVLQVVVASPNKLHNEFEQIIDNRTIATHCIVTLLLPRSLWGPPLHTHILVSQLVIYLKRQCVSVDVVLIWLRRMKGEREAGHKGLREVGNVDPDTEITFQFVANELDPQGEKTTENQSERQTPTFLSHLKGRHTAFLANS